MLRKHLLVLLLAATAIAPAVSHAATYRGRPVDGPRFNARLVNADFGAVDNVEVKFSGLTATVFLPRGSQIHLTLDDEEITDPWRVEGRDDRRGITWELSIRNLR